MQKRIITSVILLGALVAGGIARSEPPEVTHVEPPNWWVGMQHNRVQLLVYGESLEGLQASSGSPLLSIVRVDDLDSRHHAIVEIEIDPKAQPDDYTITLRSAEGEALFSFPLLARSLSDRGGQGFSCEDVIYLITPDRFANGDPTNDHVEGLMEDTDQSNPSKRHGGDLRGIIDRLDYLQGLGVTTIWMNPLLENDGPLSYHGYGATDLYCIDSRFGSASLYKQLVEEAHDRGLKIIFDHVNNHVGSRHPWLASPPEHDWFNGTMASHNLEKHYLMAVADPHADPRSSELLKSFWFVDTMPDLNCRNPRVSTYRIQNTLWWIETTGIDGIREDTYPYVDQGHLTRWAQAILKQYPEFNIVGEVWNTEPAYIALFQQGQRLPGSVETNLPVVMDFPLMEALRSFAQGEGKLREVYSVLAQDFLYSDPLSLMTFVDNHDTPRIGYIATDQSRTRLVLTILLTTRGIPQLLYGTEIGMEGGPRHVDLRADFPGGFPGDTRSAFVAESRTESEQEAFSFLHSLLDLRARTPALRRGRLIQYPVGLQEDVYKYLRIEGEERLLIIANGEQDQRMVDLSEVDGVSKDVTLVDALTGERCRLDSSMRIQVPGLRARIYNVIL